MLTLGNIAGNIFEKPTNTESLERISIDRLEMQKSRMLKKTDKGTIIGLLLEPGRILRHGDILTDGKTSVIVEQAPERILSVLIKNDTSTADLVLLGHMIGNLHRPISVKDSTVYIPIQNDSELDTFDRLFSRLSGLVDMSIHMMIFLPDNGANVHDH